MKGKSVGGGGVKKRGFNQLQVAIIACFWTSSRLDFGWQRMKGKSVGEGGGGKKCGFNQLQVGIIACLWTLSS